MQPEKLLSRHLLPNDLTLELWDKSRPTAADRWQVIVEMRVVIPIIPQNLPPTYHDKAADIIEALGSQVIFVKPEVRNFIAAPEVPALVKQIESDLLASTQGYLGHSDFAPRFIRKTYEDEQQRRRCYPPEE